MPCSPGMAKCRRGCLHRAFVRDYQVERNRQEVAREAITGGYATEEADHPPLVTFKTWLVDHAGMSGFDESLEDYEPIYA